MKLSASFALFLVAFFAGQSKADEYTCGTYPLAKEDDCSALARDDQTPILSAGDLLYIQNSGCVIGARNVEDTDLRFLQGLGDYLFARCSTGPRKDFASADWEQDGGTGCLLSRAGFDEREPETICNGPN